MSSPVAMSRHASALSPTRSEFDSTSTSLTGLYIPIHKRAPSVSSANSSTSRSVSPDMALFLNAKPHTYSPKQSKKTKKASRASSPAPGAVTRTHASVETSPATGPSRLSDNTTNLPFVYSISALLALSSSPSTLSDEQLDRLRCVNNVITTRVPKSAGKKNKGAASRKDTGAKGAEKEQDQDRVSASRRRRVGRSRKNTLTQTTASSKSADVHARRAVQNAGHVKGGYGTWGWNQYATPEALASHRHEMEGPWRHAPVVNVTTTA